MLKELQAERVSYLNKNKHTKLLPKSKPKPTSKKGYTHKTYELLPNIQQIHKLIKRRNMLLKMDRQHLIRQVIRIHYNKSLLITQECNVVLVLGSRHDGHEDYREGWLIGLHFKSVLGVG